MIKGDIPREKMLTSMPLSRRRNFLLIFREDFSLSRKPVTHAALSACEITVATAAPFTPIPRPKIKMGSRMIFATAPISTDSIAVPGLLWQMMKAFSPSASSTNKVPTR